MTLRHRARARRTHALTSVPQQWWVVVLYRWTGVPINSPFDTVVVGSKGDGTPYVYGPMTRNDAHRNAGSRRHTSDAWAVAWTGIGRNPFTLYKRAVERMDALNALES